MESQELNSIENKKNFFNEQAIDELMGRIEKVNGGIRLVVGSMEGVFTIDKLENSSGDGDTWSELSFSLKNLNEGVEAPFQLQYTKYDDKENIYVSNYSGGGGSFNRGNFGVDELNDLGSQIHFSNERQGALLDKIKETISEFIIEKSNQTLN